GLDEADVSAHDRFKLVASLLGHAEVIDMKTPVGPTAAEQRRQHPDLLQQSKSVCLERSTNDLAVPELEEGHSSVFDGLFARGKTIERAAMRAAPSPPDRYLVALRHYFLEFIV